MLLKSHKADGKQDLQLREVWDVLGETPLQGQLKMSTGMVTECGKSLKTSGERGTVPVQARCAEGTWISKERNFKQIILFYNISLLSAEAENFSSSCEPSSSTTASLIRQSRMRHLRTARVFGAQRGIVVSKNKEEYRVPSQSLFQDRRKASRNIRQMIYSEEVLDK